MHNAPSSSLNPALPRALEDPRPWIKWIARFGLWAQGFVHLVVGVLAVQLAAGLGGDTESLRSALTDIHGGPFGGILLVVLGLGFVSHALWKFVQATFDPDGIGSHAMARLFRTGFLLSGLIYLGLAYSAVRIVFLGGDGGLGGESQRVESATAFALSQPGGRWLLGILVIALVSFAIGNFVHAWRARFRDKLDQDRMRRGMLNTITGLGRAAFAARGLVFLAAAWLFTRAALEADPSEAGGMSEALGELLRQPYGRWLLAFAGAGFIAYAFFSWLLIRYRRLPG